ncbi:non-canonical purine NTP diphosphatase [Marinilabilia salmonicolor]|uniref:dITP/XTP pyrophosphatase n=1 Tax=Marinilabilia salmonicolor TaxID=989 RepID=A0A368UX62_9BACT|nr:non-canonical purine NTP diphosphatase [Marinilabilia salmonicolor]RCW31984.1 XTP/dITP diphosphohydrolase [Marinilabilia salmonicolor]
MELIFATNNQHKALEISSILGGSLAIKSLGDLDYTDEIPETGETLEENALQKARFVHRRWGKNCFADDTGLEVDALNGAPGVFSARYAGEEKDSAANIRKLLEELQDQDNRKARFRTVIALIIDDREMLFEGIVEGQILKTPEGSDGFGYDPVFKPDEANLSFAQMPLIEKNLISHRARAMNKLTDFLKKYAKDL